MLRVATLLYVIGSSWLVWRKVCVQAVTDAVSNADELRMAAPILVC